MEKRDMVPKSDEELQAFMDLFKESHADVFEMLKEGRAYFADTRDKEGHIKSYKIFKNTGELLFYENLEKPLKSEFKFPGKKMN